MIKNDYGQNTEHKRHQDYHGYAFDAELTVLFSTLLRFDMSTEFCKTRKAEVKEEQVSVTCGNLKKPGNRTGNSGHENVRLRSMAGVTILCRNRSIALFV